MRTDQEIKDWIDGKDALSRIDLARFIYGEAKRRNYTFTSRMRRYWTYVLQTKNAKDLREYAKMKIETVNKRKDAKRIEEILKSDKRFNCGSRKAKRLMNDIYGIKIARNTISNYLREYV